MNRLYPVLFRRHKGNPILTAADWPYPAHSVFNPGATLLADGTTLLLCRVEDRRGHSHLCAARSANGVDDWKIDQQPTLWPDPEHFPEELWGIEDPRITFVPELKKYAVVYTAYSREGPGVAMALTEDFKNFERFGMVMSPEDKDAALLPRRFGDQWAMIHRPVGGVGAHMWISYSSDLRRWGSQKLMMQARLGGWWDADKIGLPDALSPREREVLQLIAEGNANAVIAEKLNLSVRTVEAHRAHVMTKMNFHSQASLVRYALQQGLIEP